MSTIKDIKGIVRNASNPPGKSRYSIFLDKLVEPEHDQRGKDPHWNLWYISDNTDFCRESSTKLLRTIREKIAEINAAIAALGTDPPHGKESHPSVGDLIDSLRITFGAFLFYLHAFLESFAQEVNIFYELELSQVHIWRIARHVPEGTAIRRHLEQLNTEIFETFHNYRNAIAHGWVYKLYMDEKGAVYIGKESPWSMKIAPFMPANKLNLLDFCSTLHSEVCGFICEGWRCFGRDELTNRAKTEQGQGACTDDQESCKACPESPDLSGRSHG